MNVDMSHWLVILPFAIALFFFHWMERAAAHKNNGKNKKRQSRLSFFIARRCLG